MGYTTLLVLLGFITLSAFPLAQSADASAPTVQWSKTYSGTSGTCVIQTSDQGYLIISSPLISSSGTVLELIKTDSTGNQVWLRTYPGFPGSVLALQTKDEGYAIAGTTSDNPPKFFLAKLDSAGTVVWNSSYSDSRFDTLTNFIQTNDEGFALFGNSADYVLDKNRATFLKMDYSGHLTWNQTYGGSRDFYACGLSQTSDGGYMIAASTEYFGRSLWLIKTDSSGNTQWYRPFQNIQTYANAAFVTADGGYFILSSISSYQSGSGYYSYSGAAIKTDANGDVQWNKTYPSSYSSAFQTSDGGYVLSKSSSGTVVVSKIDGLGNTLWSGSYSDNVDDNKRYLVATADGGFALTGASQNRVTLIKLAPATSAPPIQLPPATPHATANATILQQVLFPGIGATHIIKTVDGGYAALGQVSNIVGEAYSVLLKTDSALNIQWSRSIRLDADTYMVRVVQTQDGGYAVVGERGTDAGWQMRFALVKYSSTGQLQWNQTYPLSASSDMYNYVEGFIQTSDGGFLFASTTSYSVTGAPYIVRTSSNGTLIWAKSITTPSGASMWMIAVASLVATSDGGFSIIGSDSPYSYMSSSYFELIHFDANGSTLWTKSYGNQNSDFHSGVSDGILTSDGGYLLLGGYTISNGGRYSLLLVKTDSQGNMTWFQSLDSSTLNSPGSIYQTTDGGYVFSSATDRFVSLVKVTSMGDIQSTLTLDTIFPEIQGNNLPTVVVSSDGSIVFAGQYAALNNTVNDYIWLAKVNMPTVIPEYSPITLFTALILGSITVVLASRKKRIPNV